MPPCTIKSSMIFFAEKMRSLKNGNVYNALERSNVSLTKDIFISFEQPDPGILCS